MNLIVILFILKLYARVHFFMCQIITKLAQKILLLLREKVGILFLLLLSLQKRLKCLKNSSKRGTDKCVSAVCAHIIRIV